MVKVLSLSHLSLVLVEKPSTSKLTKRFIGFSIGTRKIQSPRIGFGRNQGCAEKERDPIKEMEKEAKKEAFRKYLESCGALDALTKVLVALYEQNEKPSSAIEFIQQKLGGPTVAEHEKLQAELSDLQIRFNELSAVHQEKCRELEELKNSHSGQSAKQMNDEGASNEDP